MTKLYVLYLEGQSFRCSQTGLHHQLSDCAITSTEPCRFIGRIKERFDLIICQKIDCSFDISFLGHRQDPLAVMNELWLVDSDVFEERSDGCEAGVSCSRATPSRVFQVDQKPPDQIGVDVVQQQLCWCSSNFAFRKAQKHTERIAVPRDCMRTGMQLTHKSFCKEALNIGRERLLFDHCWPRFLSRASDRSAANRINSGTASMYQYVCCGFLCPRKELSLPEFWISGHKISTDLGLKYL